MLKDYLKKKELTIIAARPGMGKTTFALRLASELCNEQKSVLYCLLEMDKEKLAQKHYDSRIVVDDTPCQSVEHIRTTIHENRENSFSISIVIVDYLQLMNASCNYKDRAKDLYHILLDLKKLAEDDNISVIVTSQLSRKADMRKNHRPIIEDLIVYDGWKDIVDNVIFLYRPEYYGIDTDDMGKTKNRMEIIVAHSQKHPCRTFLYNFDTPIVKQTIPTYLFLDFDGVLNATNYAKLLRKEGIDHYDEFGAMFDPQTINNLKYIIEYTGCKIVLSSTWRNEGWIKMQALWKDRNLPDELFSMTPILLGTTYKDARNGEMLTIPEHNAKALEIQAWLHKYATPPFQYVILDDENIFFQSQQEHLVKTDENDGLTIQKAYEAINILNR